MRLLKRWYIHVHRCNTTYIELMMFSCGGGSIKSNSSKFSTPNDLSSNTTFPKFVRWISGMDCANNSLRNMISVYKQ